MRRILIMIPALMAAAGTLYLLEVVRPAPSTDAADQTQNETARVLVFLRNLPRGTVIDDTSIGWQEQLRSALPENAILAHDNEATIQDDLIGKVLRADILAGEIVRVTNFVDAAAGFMALALTPGMRAVGLAVTPQKLAGGFILPDDRIDLIHTAAGDFNRDGVQGSFSQTILENIRVLAVGDTATGRVTFKTADQQEAAVARKSDVNVLGDTITLEMTEAAAETLFSALASGQVSLALRALDDHGSSRIVSTVGFETNTPLPVEAPPIETSDEDTTLVPPLAESAAAAPVAHVPEMPAPSKNILVRIIQGGSASYVDVRTAIPAEGE